MRKNIYITFLVFLGLIAFLIISCKPVKVSVDSIVDCSNSIIESSEGLDINIFFDNTPSMKGFINPGSSTIYGQTMLLLEDAALNSWPGTKITFYKFGNEQNKLYGRDYLKITDPDFYDVDIEKENLRTNIEKVLNYTTTNKLTLIITDLFQDEADINIIVKKIYDKFISKGLALGIIAVKSEFDGIVYDMGIKGLKINYSSKNTVNKEDQKRYRPFYILILGNIEDIYNYYDKLLDEVEGKTPVINFLSFSEEFYPHFMVGECATLKDIDYDDSLMAPKLIPRGDLLLNREIEEYVKQFGFSKKSRVEGANIFIKTNHYITGPDGNVQFDRMNYDFENIFNYNNLEFTKELKVQDGKEEKYSDDLTRVFTINDQTINNNNLSFNIEFDPNKLPEDKTYNLKINVMLKEQKMQDYSWINDWDMDINVLVSVLEKIDFGEGYDYSKPLTMPEFEGSSTINLERLITTIDTYNKKEYMHRIAQYDLVFLR